jgi:hypothetical protein
MSNVRHPIISEYPSLTRISHGQRVTGNSLSRQSKYQVEVLRQADRTGMVQDAARGNHP